MKLEDVIMYIRAEVYFCLGSVALSSTLLIQTVQHA